MPENRHRRAGRDRETGSGGAAPAREARNLAPGRLWVAVRPHYEGLPFSGLDAARTKGGESCPDRGPTRALSAPGSSGPGDRKAAMERREARTLSQRVPAPQGVD